MLPHINGRAEARPFELRIGISGWNHKFFSFLREQQTAFVFADTAGHWPYAEELTTDFVYCRLHDDTQLYVSGYSDRALELWTGRIRRWRRGRDVFVYFDNDAKVHAPFDAQRLAALLA